MGLRNIYIYKKCKRHFKKSNNFWFKNVTFSMVTTIYYDDLTIKASVRTQ